MTNLQPRGLVRFALRLESLIPTVKQTEQGKLAPAKSSTQFGMGKIRQHHKRDPNHADGKHRSRNHIAKARPRIETRRADPSARS